jgi:hypothetical protein
MMGKLGKSAKQIYDILFLSWNGGEVMVNVVRNPTKRDVSKLLKESKGGALRVARDCNTDDLYVWDSEAALHNDVIRKFNLEYADSGGVAFGFDDLEENRQAP